MSLFTRKPVFGVFDQVRLKPACSASEASWSHEILNLASIGIILSQQRTTRPLICTFVVHKSKNRFSHDEADMSCYKLKFSTYRSA